MKARVRITLKEGILDPQGKAIAQALGRLGFDGVESVRQGKYVEIELRETNPGKARAQVEDMCAQLLANTVMEEYSVEVGEDLVRRLSPGGEGKGEGESHRRGATVKNARP